MSARPMRSGTGARSPSLRAVIMGSMPHATPSRVRQRPHLAVAVRPSQRMSGQLSFTRDAGRPQALDRRPGCA